MSNNYKIGKDAINIVTPAPICPPCPPCPPCPTHVYGYAEAFVRNYSITNHEKVIALYNLEIALTEGGLINYGTPSSNKVLNLYPMIGGTVSATSLGNFLNLAAPLTAYGGLTYNNSGITGNGINGYLDTGIYADSLTIANSHFGFCDKNLITGTNGDEGFGLLDGSPYAAVLPNFYGTTIDDLADSSFRISYADSGVAGSYYLTNFTSPNTKQSYLTGVLKGTTVSPALPNNKIVYLGARQFYSVNTMDFAHFGYSLTTAQISTMNAAILQFNTTLGR